MISLPDEVIAILESYTPGKPDAFLFAGSPGGTSVALQRPWRRVAKAAGLDPGLVLPEVHPSAPLSWLACTWHQHQLGPAERLHRCLALTLLVQPLAFVPQPAEFALVQRAPSGRGRTGRSLTSSRPNV